MSTEGNTCYISLPFELRKAMRLRSRTLWRSRRKNRNPPKKSVQFAETPTVLGETQPKRKCIKRPPDGGWSWIVLLGIFVMTTQSLFSVSGLLLGEPIRSWGYDVSEVAAASTMIVAVQNFFGLSSGLLIRKWHARNIGVAGTLLVFTGLVLTSRATDLWMVFLTWGLMAGVGMGMVVPSAFLILTHYFERYRRYAIGVAVAGTGLGQMLLPIVLHKLQIEYQFSGACLIIASISLQALPGYLLCRPIKPKPQPLRSESLDDSVESLTRFGIRVPRRHRHRKCKRCRVLLKTCYYTTGIALLSNPVLANTIICTSLIYMTIICFTAVLPLYLRDGGELTPSVVTHFMTIMSGSDLASRVLLPIIQEKFKIRARTVVMISALVGSIFRSIMVEIPDRSVILITLIMSGISRAAIVLNINLSLAEMVAPADLMATIGVSMVCKAMSTLTVGSFIGWLHDITKSYKVYMHSLTVVVIVTFTSWLIEVILLKYFGRNNADGTQRQIDDDLEYPEASINITSGAGLLEEPQRRDTAEERLSDDDVTEQNQDDGNKKDRRRSAANKTKRKYVRRTAMFKLECTSRSQSRRQPAQPVRQFGRSANTKETV